MSGSWRGLWLASTVAAFGACGQSPGAAPTASASGSATVAIAGGSKEKLRDISVAEQTRDASKVTDALQRDRDLVVRRASARALARIGGAAAKSGLDFALGDEDPEVVAWAAYGLGFSCAAARDDIVARLVARVLTLPAATPPAENAPVTEKAAYAYDPFAAIARAVGQCAATTSEESLLAWMRMAPERLPAVALALGDLAGEKKRLREETLAALLNLAAGGASQKPVAEAFFPIARLENVPPTILTRLIEVATARVDDPNPYRVFVIRALGRAKGGAVPVLARILERQKDFTVPERVEAMRALGRIGEEGQPALRKALAEASELEDAVLLATRYEDVMTLLVHVQESAEVKAPLAKLAARSVPDSSTNARDRRRIIQLRCSAAKLAAKANEKDPLLVACDPDRTSIGKRALVEVLGRGYLEGTKLTAYRALLTDPDVRVREAAIELLSGHAEIDASYKILIDALRAKETGVVATAAEQLAKVPSLAAVAERPKPKKGKDAKPDAKPEPKDDHEHVKASPDVVKALSEALGRAHRENDPELEGTIIDAIAALELTELAGTLDDACGSSSPALRGHAEKALTRLRGKKVACDVSKAAAVVPSELGSAPFIRPVTLVFDTEAGELRMTLDPALAPVAVRRFVDLGRAGYYKDNVIHRVDPSFVVQFGAPFGDGFGGPTDRPPLRCETSPLPFEHLSIGVALSGRDTGSSQLFVMRGRYPHLDGKYAIVGRASGNWDGVFEGDVIRGVRVEE